MTAVCVTTEVETWREDGPDTDYLNDVPYSYRGSTGGRVTNVIAYLDTEVRLYYGESYGKDMDVRPGDMVYAVVADYSTGDTFGRDGGHSQVLDVFEDPYQAARLLEAADVPEGYSFEFEGRDYSRNWVGYFEHLNSLEVWACRVRPDRWTDGPRPGFRPGH